jgi:hypothetical protein
MTGVNGNPRAEFGGILLIACGAPPGSLAAAVEKLHQGNATSLATSLSASLATSTCLKVLAYPAQAGELADCGIAAADIWWLSRPGPKGFLALIRRISWYRFARVYQPWSQELGWLKFFIWPRPSWHQVETFS